MEALSWDKLTPHEILEQINEKKEKKLDNYET
jgi:hypothetical protein